MFTSQQITPELIELATAILQAAKPVEPKPETEKEVDDWVRLKDYPKINQNYTYPQIKWLARNRKINGLNDAIRKPSKELFISHKRFIEWLDKHEG